MYIDEIELTPKQKSVHFFNTAPIKEIFYGGEAGGGKTFYMLRDMWDYCITYPGAYVCPFRKTYPELTSFTKLIAEKFNPKFCTILDNGRLVRFKNGSVLEGFQMPNDASLYKYRSFEIDYLGLDELTSFRKDEYMQLLSRNRTSKRTPNGHLYPSITRSCSNPGNNYEKWVFERFVKVAKNKPYQNKENAPYRMFIPAGLKDNPHIDDNYKYTLEEMPELERRRLLNGEWNLSTSKLIDHTKTKFDNLTGKSYDKIFITGDTAFGDKEINDYSVLALWGFKDNKLSLLDIFRRKVKASQLLNIAITFHRKNSSRFNCNPTIYIENKASGIQLNQDLHELGFPVKKVTPKGKAKIDRYNNIAYYYESFGMTFNNIISSDILDELIDEMRTFGGEDKGLNDDFIDCMVYAFHICYGKMRDIEVVIA